MISRHQKILFPGSELVRNIVTHQENAAIPSCALPFPAEAPSRLSAIWDQIRPRRCFRTTQQLRQPSLPIRPLYLLRLIQVFVCVYRSAEHLLAVFRDVCEMRHEQIARVRGNQYRFPFGHRVFFPFIRSNSITHTHGFASQPYRPLSCGLTVLFQRAANALPAVFHPSPGSSAFR